MKTYYKIVSSDGLFAEQYNIVDVNDIPNGSRFKASEFSKGAISRGGTVFTMFLEKPVINFCDNAFDTMLWYPGFSNVSYEAALAGTTRQCCIYEIVPITRVFKDRSKSLHELRRCGADIIEFGNLVPVAQVAKLAMNEYKRCKLMKHIMYGSEFVRESVEKWKKRYSL